MGSGESLTALKQESNHICISESSSDYNLEGGFEENKTGRICSSVCKNILRDFNIGQKNEVTFPHIDTLTWLIERGVWQVE